MALEGCLWKPHRDVWRGSEVAEKPVRKLVLAFSGLGQICEHAFLPYFWTPGQEGFVVRFLKSPWHLGVSMRLHAGLGCQE